MRDISNKEDGIGDQLSADTFNSLMIELEEIAKSAGFTLDPEAGPDTDTEMLSKSIAQYVLLSQYFIDSGAADAYVLNRTGTIKSVTEYSDGLLIFFKSSNSNTGASTINVDSLGVKDLTLSDGTALTAGAILANHYVIARYNSSSDDFEIVYSDIASTGDNIAKQVELDTTPDTDETANGVKASKTVDTNSVGFGCALCLGADGNYDEADASSSSTMPCTALALESGTGSKQVLKQGYIRDDSWSWTAGGVLYVSTTTGTLTQTAPSGTGEIVQVVGLAESSTIIYFSPSYDTAEVA